MDAHHESERKFDTLRRQAEELIQNSKDVDAAPHADVLDLIHELRVHQVELQIQNEELRRAQSELAKLHKKYADLFEFAPCGYLNLNAKGVVMQINLAGVILLGAPRSTILRTVLSHYLDAGHHGLYHRTLLEAVRSAQKQRLELQLATKEGPARWVWAEIEADTDREAQVQQWRITLADISSKKEAEAALHVIEERYRQLFGAMVSGAVMYEIAKKNSVGAVRDVRFIEVNPAFEKLTGITRDRVVGKTIRQLWPDIEQFWLDQVDIAQRNGQSRAERFFRPLKKHILCSVFKLDDHLFCTTFSDISARVAIEEALKTRLRESTAEKQDANTALRMVLRQSEKGRQDLEEQIIANLNEMTRPNLDRLASSNLSRRQRLLLDAVNESLDSLSSPLSRHFMLENMRLTPTESRVAGLIRQGKSTKEIAQILGVATSTVNFHRHNIRRKLKLSRDMNLQSHLNSLE